VNRGNVVLVVILRVSGAGAASLPVQLAITSALAKSAEVRRINAHRTSDSGERHLRSHIVP
jgi:hypothetical protein